MSAFSSIALWWAIPAVATVMTMIWVWWAGRSRNPDDVLGSTEKFDQFRKTMSAMDIDLRQRERSRQLVPEQPGTGTSPATDQSWKHKPRLRRRGPSAPPHS